MPRDSFPPVKTARAAVNIFHFKMFCMHTKVPAAPVGWATENGGAKGIYIVLNLKIAHAPASLLLVSCIQEGIFDLSDRSRKKSPIYPVDVEGLVILSSAHLDGGLF